MEAPAPASSGSELSANDAKAMADLADVDMGDFTDEDEDEDAAPSKPDAVKAPDIDAESVGKAEPSSDTESADKTEPPSETESADKTEPPPEAEATDKTDDTSASGTDDKGEADSSAPQATSSDADESAEDADASVPVRGRVSVPNLVVPDDEEDVARKSFDGHTYRTGELEAQQRATGRVTDTPDIGDWEPGGRVAAADDEATDEPSVPAADAKPPEPEDGKQPGSAWDAFAQPWLDDGSDKQPPETDHSAPESDKRDEAAPESGTADREQDAIAAGAPEAEFAPQPEPASHHDGGQPRRPSEPEAEVELPAAAVHAGDDSAQPHRDEAASPDPAGADWPVSIDAVNNAAPARDDAAGAKGVASVPAGQLLAAGDLPAELPNPVAQVYGGEPEASSAWPPPSDS